jgi:cell division protein FtsN
MIAVETVIKKLVSDYEFVIIPGFGALLSRQIPAVYDKDSGVFSPPVKKLAFNEFLKLDDGFLANYISREEQIAHTEAVNRIRQYTDNLKSALGIKGQTEIEGVGTFNTNIEGKLVFEPNNANCFKDEWYGFSKITVKSVERKEALKIQTVESATPQSHVEVLEEDSSSELKINWLRWASAAALAGLMFYVSFFLVTSVKNSTTSTLNPFAFSEEKGETVVVTQPSNSVDTQEKVTEKPIEDNKVVAPEVTMPEVAKPAPVATVGVEQGKRFYLIAGTFNGLKRANILLADLQEKGFKQAVVLPAGERSKKVKVAVQGFDHEGEAYAASAKLKSVIGEPGWVLRMK